MSTFTQEEIQAIADALGDTAEGLTGSEIAHLLLSCAISDTDPAITKRVRLYNAFAHDQNCRKDRTRILGFIRKAMKPARFAKEPHRFEPMRANLNRALAFAGLSVNEAGELVSSVSASTLSEAEERARVLRPDLSFRGVHSDVLEFCRAELVTDDYFHAVLEAVKSVGNKLRKMTGCKEDGGPLVDRTLTGPPPMVAINPLQTKSQEDEQRGFANLVKGTFGMFRNPTAHDGRVNWIMTKDDAEDLLSLVSLIHRRLDGSQVVVRT